MPTLTVTHDVGDRMTLTMRSHEVTADQPLADGGTDTGPTPTELFVGGLAACVGFYVRRYLHRHGLAEDPLTVTAQWTMAANPARVGTVEVEVTVPESVPAERRAALLAVASHCTVHNSLATPPDVHVRLLEEELPAA